MQHKMSKGNCFLTLYVILNVEHIVNNKILSLVEI